MVAVVDVPQPGDNNRSLTRNVIVLGASCSKTIFRCYHRTDGAANVGRYLRCQPEELTHTNTCFIATVNTDHCPQTRFLVCTNVVEIKLKRHKVWFMVSVHYIYTLERRAILNLTVLRLVPKMMIKYTRFNTLRFQFS